MTIYYTHFKKGGFLAKHTSLDTAVIEAREIKGTVSILQGNKYNLLNDYTEWESKVPF